MKNTVKTLLEKGNIGKGYFVLTKNTGECALWMNESCSHEISGTVMGPVIDAHIVWKVGVAAIVHLNSLVNAQHIR